MKSNNKKAFNAVYEAREFVDINMLLEDVFSVYRQTWPAHERENEDAIRQRMESGTDRLFVLIGNCEKEMNCCELKGFYFLSTPPKKEWSILRHMAVRQDLRNKGLGSNLCRDAMNRLGECGTKWLVLEAQARQRVFYSRLGFVSHSTGYAAPMGDGSYLPMTIMSHGKTTMQNSLVMESVIDNLLTFGYGLSPSDGRYKAITEGLKES